MSPEIVSILVLVAIFVIATILPVNMGVLAFAAAVLVGGLISGMTADDLFAVFPGDLFIVLVGVTYLFGIAQVNGTVDWLVHLAVRGVGGHLAAIPWIMFCVAAVLTAVGAASPAGVAIVAPIALGFAAQYGISPMLMGLLVVHGAQAGAFSTISIYGAIVNGLVARAGLPQGEITLFLGSLVFNLVLGVIVFVLFGGLALLRREPAQVSTSGADSSEPNAEEQEAREDGRSEESEAAEDRGFTWQMGLTIAGILVVVAVAAGFGFDVGLVAITVAGVLALFMPNLQREAVGRVSWSVVLLICGVLTYVGVLEEIGTIDYVGEAITQVGAPALAALLICYVGGIVSAFASSTGMLAAIIPLAVPFLQEGAVGAIGVVTAVAISTTVVDASPLSTNGALVLANAKNVDRDVLFRHLLAYGAVVAVVAPPLAWFVFVVLGIGS
ncbi:MAG TPA: SLC13 family permease [Rubrobacter sp.]|nr:SLC13 family permease [Rubrobacter sp.]